MICPANGGLVEPGNIKVSAEVNYPTMVQRVEFYQGTSKIGEVQKSFPVTISAA